MPAAALLLLLVGALYWAPDHVADMAGWRPAAVDYVAAGMEAALAWLGAAVVCWRYTGPRGTRPWRAGVPVAAGAMVEASMRSGCRLMLPMDRPLTIGDMTTCEAAMGMHMTWVSVVVALTMVAVVAGAERGGRHERA